MEIISKKSTRKLLEDSGINRERRSFTSLLYLAILKTKNNYDVFNSNTKKRFMRQKVWSYFNEFVSNQPKRMSAIMGSVNVYPKRVEIEFELSPSITPSIFVNSLKSVLARKFLKQFERYRETLDGHLWSPTYALYTKEKDIEEQRKQYLRYSKDHKHY